MTPKEEFKLMKDKAEKVRKTINKCEELLNNIKSAANILFKNISSTTITIGKIGKNKEDIFGYDYSFQISPQGLSLKQSYHLNSSNITIKKNFLEILIEIYDFREKVIEKIKSKRKREIFIDFFNKVYLLKNQKPNPVLALDKRRFVYIFPDETVWLFNEKPPLRKEIKEIHRFLDAHLKYGEEMHRKLTKFYLYIEKRFRNELILGSLKDD